MGLPTDLGPADPGSSGLGPEASQKKIYVPSDLCSPSHIQMVPHDPQVQPFSSPSASTLSSPPVVGSAVSPSSVGAGVVGYGVGS